MIVVFPFCLRDQDLALKNARWMHELGGCKGHELLVCYDPRCNPGQVEAIRMELGRSFDKLYKCTAQAQIDGWPEGANYFFRITTAWLQGDPLKWPYFFWMEPDAIPLRPGWLDALEAEYKGGGRPFMGDRVEVTIDEKEVPLHMSGIGIYENPVYLRAGEAYRAHDIAWDMAAKDQIVPNAYFTNLIEHAWKHPKFTSNDELRTQIAPETILFHSSKDGSLIDLLRDSLTQSGHQIGDRSAVQVGGPAPNGLSGREVGATSFPHPQSEVYAGSSPVQAAPVFDIFIRTYPGDYEWLDYCLQSMGRFVTGFRKIWIVSHAEPPGWLEKGGHLDAPVEWKVMNDETEDGYLAQQITKLYADVLTDYQSDYILHVDSDIIFTRPTTPQDFFTGDKLTWYHTPYELIQTPWQPIISKFMGFHQPYEFMRRLPMMIPRWLYPRLREFAFKLHRMPISQYIANQPLREFSEFNVLGAYAFFHHRDRFAFVDTSTVYALPEPCARQFHSWSGLTEEVKSEIESILRDGVEAARHAHNVEVEGSIPSPATNISAKAGERAPSPMTQALGPAIKELPNGVWVLEGDQISGWVEQEGRLDHDQNLLPDILKHIRPGDSVVDAGAFIGDHTVAYANAVGDTGIVHAFEPNPMAYKCLSHNLEACNNVVLHGYGLSNEFDTVPLSGNNGNWGGVYVGEHMKITDIRVRALETEIPWRVNFIKIDVEGYELKVLQGAGNLINRCHPIMVIEINSEALRRQGATPDEIFGWLTQHGYDWKIIQENCLRNDPLYDILCLPKKPPEIFTSDAKAHLPASSPVAPLTIPEEVQLLVDQLQEIADASPGNKAIVTSKLFFAGLRQQVKRKKKKKTKQKPWP